MRKTRLAPQDLAVESFEVTPAPEKEKGTVVGHENTQLQDTCLCSGQYDYTCHVNTCAFYVTCHNYPEYSCNYTCEGVGDTCQHCG